MSKYYLYLFIILLGLGWSSKIESRSMNMVDPYQVHLAATEVDTIPLIDRQGNFAEDPTANPFDIQSSLITQEVEYDPESGHYIIFEKIGDEYYRNPSYMTFEEYLVWKGKQQEKDYFKRLAGISSTKSSTGVDPLDPMGKLDINTSMIDKLFGSNEITIKPKGNFDLTFGYDWQKSEGGALTGFNGQNEFVTQGIDFDMGIQMGVEGKIGDMMDLNFNYNTQATFDFDNQLKLAYGGSDVSEDNILRSIEAGDVALPLRSQLIQGSQSLFGVKTELQFGKLKITGLAAQQRTKQKSIKVENGSLIQDFEVRPDQYDENRHFFINHYTRGQYEEALLNMPQINSLFRIMDIEVWVSTEPTDDLVNSTTVAAISYLGEPDLSNYSDPNPKYPPKPNFGFEERDRNGKPLPSNEVSDLFSNLVRDDDTRRLDNTSTNLTLKYGMTKTRDFEVQSMRKLNANEYSFNANLGFISLSRRLRPNQVLAVAYQYSYASHPDIVYKIGELSNQTRSNGVLDREDPKPQEVVFTKMLKSSNQRTDLPSWDLMMKNVYPIGAGQLNQEDFQLDIFYEDNEDVNLKRFIPEPQYATTPLLDIFQLDRLNSQGDPQQDGIFDFVPGVTVVNNTGSIIFPVLEPFGSSLFEFFEGNEALYAKYGYAALYDTTVTLARKNLEGNRFLIKGKVKSSVSSEIPLGAFNVPPGSVTVRAGSQLLIEGVDYDVDYGIGRVKIINDSYLQSGVPISISLEDKSLFAQQQRTMFGLRFDYEANEKLNIGGTYMRLFERPFTEKVNIGDDPINNRIFGLDMNYSTESEVLTRIVDKLPFYSTKEPSSINFEAEFAALKPSHSSAINVGDEQGGVVSIDDFEGASTSIPLGSRTNIWALASTPSRFDESQNKDLTFGVNRAKLNWYVVNDRGIRTNEDNMDPYSRIVNQDELFDREQDLSQIRDLLTFDLSYYPEERGPYNFDLPEGTAFSAGLDIDAQKQCVKLKNPEERWAGITRFLPNNDFEAANYEYIEFWMLNPFMDRRNAAENPDPGEQGYLYFNLGNVSEDVMHDNLVFFENSIPVEGDIVPTIKTPFGIVPTAVPAINGFDVNNRAAQDLGLDGLDDEGERSYFEDYVNKVRTAFSQDTCVFNDPANDNYVAYRDTRFQAGTPLLERFKNQNNPEANATNNTNIIGVGNNLPDTEDLNGNRSLDDGESYFEYRIPIFNNAGEIDIIQNKYITEDTIIQGPSGSPPEKWYRFRIPISEGTSVNGIQSLRSIQFMRMYMTGFSKPKTFRLAEFELVRNQWRRLPLQCGGDNAPSDVNFIVDEVGIQENRGKQPFRYETPKGIKQERIFSTFSNILQDEKSLKMVVESLPDSCQAAICKLTELDLRFFKKLQMFVHAESQQQGVDNEDMSLFIRVGKDFSRNYYEYELPLYFSDADVANAAPNTADYRTELWRDENRIDFFLDLFTELKKERNRANFSIQEEFIGNATIDTANVRAKLKIRGNPSLGYIKGIFVGIRNKSDNKGSVDAEVWINELRLSGFDEEGGVAGLARLDMQLADLGDITMSTKYNSIGWGAIDQKVSDRSLTRNLEYDMATNLNLGKFFPEKWNLRIPFYAQYAKNIVKNKYDPYELDLTTDEVLETADDPADVRDRGSDVTTIKTFNFTNVKMEKGGGSQGSPKPWSPSNISLNYGYTQTKHKNAIIKEEAIDDYRGGIDYNYSRKVGYIEPFKGVQSKALRLIKEINFNPLPNSFTFSTTLRRFKSRKEYRVPADPDYVFDDRRFDWNRRYGLQWDFTKSLRLSFNANNFGVVDELKQVGIKPNAADRIYQDVSGRDSTMVAGRMRSYSDLVNEDPNYTKRYLLDNVKRFGRNKTYDHQLDVTYTLPFKYIPYMDWITAKATYNADFAWNRASLATESLGNTIQNNQSRAVNATLSFDKLYNKSKYLKSLDKSTAAPRRRDRNPGKEEGAEDSKTPVVTREKKSSDDGPSFVEKLLLRPLLSIRNVKLNYKENFSTFIPGFLPSPSYVGLGENWSAPGVGFVFGIQPDIRKSNSTNWLITAGENGWFTTDPLQNQQIATFSEQNFDAKIELEPWKDLRISVNFKKGFSENHTEDFKVSLDNQNNYLFEQSQLRDIGSYDVTYGAIGTFFGKSGDELFASFENSRTTVSSRLATRDFEQGIPITPHAKDVGYFTGYGLTHNQVLIPAFLAAYTGKDVRNISLDTYEDIKSKTFIPRPNWDLKYNGLSKLPFFSEIFSGFTLNHAYKSMMRVNSFETDINYREATRYQVASNIRTVNYYSRIEIPTLVIKEDFAPLIGLEMKTHSGMNINFDYAKSRSIELSAELGQVVYNNSSTIGAGFGWTLENVNIGFLTGAKKKTRARPKAEEGDAELFKPDEQKAVTNTRGRSMVIGMSFALQDNIRKNYILDSGQKGQTINGTNSININPTIDYEVNENFTLQLFLDYSKTVSETTNRTDITSYRGGLVARFILN